MLLNRLAKRVLRHVHAEVPPRCGLGAAPRGELLLKGTVHAREVSRTLASSVAQLLCMGAKARKVRDLGREVQQHSEFAPDVHSPSSLGQVVPVEFCRVYREDDGKDLEDGGMVSCHPPTVSFVPMCGRFSHTIREIVDASQAFGAEFAPEHAAQYRPRWNIAPTDSHWVIRLDDAGRRRMVPARFGFAGASGQPIINARSETAAELATFRRAFLESRCLVPADGFYEWRGGRGERRPLWFHDPSGRPLTFAGLALQREGALAFVILTTAANELMRPVHDRMPVLLSPEGAEAWLTRTDAGVLTPAPQDWLAAREVSARVNSVANDGPELLEPPPPARQLRLV